MARTYSALITAINEATLPDFRGRLLARGRAKALISRNGELPENSPNFSDNLRYDLLSYGFALLDHGLRLEALISEEKTKTDYDKSGHEMAARAFRAAGDALSSVVLNAASTPERDFHRLAAGCAYHFAKLAARAYSLVHENLSEANMMPGERAIALLVVRDFTGLRELLYRRLSSGELDASVSEGIERIGSDKESGSDQADQAGIIDTALTEHFLRAISVALLAFERGDDVFVSDAIKRLRRGLKVATDAALIDQWWAHRLAIRLLGDLWEDSFHQLLPPSLGTEEEIGLMRETFIASLLRRERAEIGLWPSQIDAARRAFDPTDDMVVALPTSAGKTRVAELCILNCIARGFRIVFVTPLRALSAQTETTLRRSFSPLGIRVSALYGAMGEVGEDHEIMVEDHIVVTTPEKLDFALRNSPDILDDVGLIVLDEGHMIGMGQREVRYEVQVQRLLRRVDAKNRRIVCLSAVLPSGPALDDFTEWLTGDALGGRVESNWRPTELRYGEVLWHSGDEDSGYAQLRIDIPGQKTFVPRFIEGRVPPKGQRKKPFPTDQRELCLAVAKRFVEEGRTVLIFCPQRRSVGKFAEVLVDLHKRGAIPSFYRGDPLDLDAARAIGAEWFGPDSDVVSCLNLGVAIHHGSLPTPFRREVDRLIALGRLPLVVASPTLAQGLNLSAAVLIFFGLKSSKDLIEVADFRNVVGRAGRAYVDAEGLVLLPSFEQGEIRRNQREAWRALISSNKGREMRSGLARIVFWLFRRLKQQSGIKDVDQAIEYIANATNWKLKRLGKETELQFDTAQGNWRQYLDSLDTAILSLTGDQTEAETADVADLLDDLLQSSLWSRTLDGLESDQAISLTATLKARAQHVFRQTTSAQRRFFFFAGVGLVSGQALESQMHLLGPLLLSCEAAFAVGDVQEALNALIQIAGIVFDIPPFEPRSMRSDWPQLLKLWIVGDPLPFEAGDKVSHFVEDAFVYRLVWALEVVRLRGELPDVEGAHSFSLEDQTIELSALFVEMGACKIETALLLREGLASRIAARAATESTSRGFASRDGLRRWLSSKEVRTFEKSANWPTTESHLVWMAFRDGQLRSRAPKWSTLNVSLSASWDGPAPERGMPVVLQTEFDGLTTVLTPDLHNLGTLKEKLDPKRAGVTEASVGRNSEVRVRYIGPGDFYPT